ncbi:hypothetical protein ANO14919_054020 [Xylariales sp. No.14919]|nr:hypothetical protein ANO14919_054020 [Xylariales sp. No.14919]
MPVYKSTRSEQKYALVAHVLVPDDAHEIFTQLHNISLQSMTGIKSEYLFAAFAEKIFRHCKYFAEDGVSRPGIKLKEQEDHSFIPVVEMIRNTPSTTAKKADPTSTIMRPMSRKRKASENGNAYDSGNTYNSSNAYDSSNLYDSDTDDSSSTNDSTEYFSTDVPEKRGRTLERGYVRTPSPFTAASSGPRTPPSKKKKIDYKKHLINTSVKDYADEDILGSKDI